VAGAAPSLAARESGTFDAAAAAYLNRDFAASLRIVRSLAAKGDARGQYYLGRHYQFGEGVAKDNGEAFYWYRRAETAGHVEAKFFRVMLENYWKLSAADKARGERKLAMLKPGSSGKDGPTVAAVAGRPPVEGVKSRPTFRDFEPAGAVKDNAPPRSAEPPPSSETKPIVAARAGEMARLEVRPRPPAAAKSDERPATSIGKPTFHATAPEKPRTEPTVADNAAREAPIIGNSNATVPADDARTPPPRYAAPPPNVPAYAYSPPPTRPLYDYPPHFYRSFVPRPAYAPPPGYYPYVPNAYSMNGYWHPGWRRVPHGFVVNHPID
jgi:hypothetical protein